MTGTDNKEPSLESLMRHAQQGDKRSYAALFQAVIPSLRAFVSRRISATADVDDVVQDILLSIHRAGHTYDTDRPFRIWMFTIARHRVNDYLRRTYRKRAFPEIRLEDLTEEVAAGNVTEHRDRYEYLNRAISSLPEKQKQIIVFMKLQGHTAEETAKAMNMSVSAVKVAAHRAYRSLAVKLEEEEE